jgi:hypothetical protein
MPMPLIKVGYLFVKTIAKPVSSTIKQQAKDHPKFREACVRIAQFYHRMDVRWRRKLSAKAGEDISAVVRPLDEQKAIELGASFIGEALIFGVAGTLLVAEATRSNRAETARRKLTEDRFEQIFEDVLNLTEKQQELIDKISDMEHRLAMVKAA